MVGESGSRRVERELERVVVELEGSAELAREVERGGLSKIEDSLSGTNVRPAASTRVRAS